MPALGHDGTSIIKYDSQIALEEIAYADIALNGIPYIQTKTAKMESYGKALKQLGHKAADVIPCIKPVKNAVQIGIFVHLVAVRLQGKVPLCGDRKHQSLRPVHDIHIFFGSMSGHRRSSSYLNSDVLYKIKVKVYCLYFLFARIQNAKVYLQIVS